MSDLYLRVREATGCDVTGRDVTGRDGSGGRARARVVVAGAPGSGVGELTGAITEVAPDLEVTGHRPGESLPVDACDGIGVLVIDPSSAPEPADVDLVTRLRTEIGTVVLVCAKIDAFWEWPRRLREHRRHLDPDEELPLFAVSAAAALAGAVDESGVDDLVSWIVSAGSAPTADRRERMRTGACLGALDAALLAETSARPEPADDAETLMHRRRLLVASRDRGRTDRLAAVRAGLAGVRAASLADAQTGARVLAHAATQRIAQAGPRQLADHPAWVDQEVARLNARIGAVTDDRLDEVTATTLLGIETGDPRQPGGPSDRARPPAGSGYGPSPVPGRQPPSGRRGAEDALVVLLGASTGIGLGRLAVAPMASVHTLQWVSMPLTLVIGVAVALWVVGVRRAGARRAELRAWSAEVLAEARATIERGVAAAVTDTESRLTGQIIRHHERRVRQVSADVAALDEQLRGLRAERAGADRQRQARVDELRRLRATAAARVQELWMDGAAEPDVGEERRDGPVRTGRG
ncbi:hypothetical protein ABLE92_19615 [Gordonia sp. VNQ95]|uniref:hypothetical protein n=1 Tax=Gordonia sp. VNQ95 TaxID=3156619 RepID=UPI0032B493B6